MKGKVINSHTFKEILERLKNWNTNDWICLRNLALPLPLCGQLHILPDLGLPEGNGSEQIILKFGGLFVQPRFTHCYVLQQVISSIIPNDEYIGFEPLRPQVSSTGL